MDSMKKTQDENSRKVVARALDVCAQRQVTAKATVVEGEPKEAICHAVDMRADLLVLSSRGLGMVKREKCLSTHTCTYFPISSFHFFFEI